MLLKALRRRTTEADPGVAWEGTTSPVPYRRQYRRTAPTLPVPEKEELLRTAAALSTREMARLYGVGQTTIRRWCKQHGIDLDRKRLLQITVRRSAQ